MIIMSLYKVYSIGFGVQGKNILLEDNTVYNEDDCLMIGPPSSNIHFRNSYCSGGHGLSIGPFGEGGSVDIQNVMYVNRILVKSIVLIPLEVLRALPWYHNITFYRKLIYLVAGKFPLWSKVQELDRVWWCRQKV